MKRIIITWQDPMLVKEPGILEIAFKGNPQAFEVLGVLRHFSKHLEIKTLLWHRKMEGLQDKKLKKGEKGK